MIHARYICSWCGIVQDVHVCAEFRLLLRYSSLVARWSSMQQKRLRPKRSAARRQEEAGASCKRTRTHTVHELAAVHAHGTALEKKDSSASAAACHQIRAALICGVVLATTAHDPPIARRFDRPPVCRSSGC